MFKTSNEASVDGSRRILVTGSPGTGKTTFSVSASEHAGDTLSSSGEPVVCKDVALLQGDADGQQGARNVGLLPGLVSDYSTCETFDEYKKQLSSDLQDLAPMVKAGDIKIVVVDLAQMSQLLCMKIKPADPAGWGRVGAEAMVIFQSFSLLKGATVIANAHLKVAASPVENASAIEAANARSTGGARSTFEIALPGSVYIPWRNHASLELAREVKRTKTGREYFTHTEASDRFPAKSRFGSVLKPTEPGDRTLSSILSVCYPAK